MHKQAYDAVGSHIGIFDGEYLYNLSGEVILRVDGNEIYSMDIPCKCLGTLEGGEASDLNGILLFRVEN